MDAVIATPAGLPVTGPLTPSGRPNTFLHLGVTEVKSPLSDTIVLRYDSETKQTERTMCIECALLIKRGRGVRLSNPFFDNGVGDPLYFLAAAVEFETIVVPRYGRVAFETGNRGACRRFLSGFTYDEKKVWQDVTGTPFPFRYFK